MKKWYALHTRPHAETRVAHQLAQWDIETFLPGTGYTDGNREERFRPLFPGYLFIYLNLRKERAAAWLNLPAVRYVVAYDNEPVPIVDDVMRVLKQRAAELRAARKEGEARFVPGGLVRIKDGPFKDMLAIFEGSSGQSQRVRVLLQALDRAMRLQLSPSNLDVVDSPIGQRKRKRRRRTRGRGRRIKS